MSATFLFTKCMLLNFFSQAVHATRFITKNSIEEKMYQLQQKKQLVFEGTVDGSSASLAKLTTEDLAFLFHS